MPVAHGASIRSNAITPSNVRRLVSKVDEETELIWQERKNHMTNPTIVRAWPDGFTPPPGGFTPVPPDSPPASWICP
eukprot:3720564-Pyramimonas_sp.AAC.1